MGIEQSEHQGAIARQITDEVKAALGGTWEKLSVGEVQMVADAASDAAGLQIAALAAATPEARDAVAREMRQITAQLANIRAAGESTVANAFQRAVTGIAARGLDALTLLISAAL